MTYCSYCGSHQTELVKSKTISDAYVIHEYVCQRCLEHFIVREVRE